jgi:hypothetical protein
MVNISMDEFAELSKEDQKALMKAESVRLRVLKQRVDDAETLDDVRDVAPLVHNHTSVTDTDLGRERELEQVALVLQKGGYNEASEFVIEMIKQRLISSLVVEIEQCDS